MGWIMLCLTDSWIESWKQVIFGDRMWKIWCFIFEYFDISRILTENQQQKIKQSLVTALNIYPKIEVFLWSTYIFCQLQLIQKKMWYKSNTTLSLTVLGRRSDCMILWYSTIWMISKRRYFEGRFVLEMYRLRLLL